MKIEDLDTWTMWPLSGGSWMSDARSCSGTLYLHPCEKWSRAARLLRQLGIKRIRWGYFYEVATTAGECGLLRFSAIKLPNGKTITFPSTNLDRREARIRASERSMDLRARWRKVHSCVFAAGLSSDRRARIHRICDRLADRIDALTPWVSTKYPRLTA